MIFSTHLRCDPTRGPEIRPRNRTQFFGGAKVGQLNIPMAIHKNIGALDVSMNDVVRVEIFQSFTDLSCETRDHIIRERTSGFEQGVDRSTINELQVNFQKVLINKGSIELNDIFVIELGQNFPFLFETRKRVEVVGRAFQQFDGQYPTTIEVDHFLYLRVSATETPGELLDVGWLPEPAFLLSKAFSLEQLFVVFLFFFGKVASLFRRILISHLIINKLFGVQKSVVGQNFVRIVIFV
jgi:hypothetical protein